MLRAHNNMPAQMTHGPCSTACSPTAILTCLATLLLSLQLTPPNPPSTFPTHVDWFMYASMSGSLVPTRTNDAPRHPTARMQHQTSPPAQLDGTGLLQMPPQRAKSPAAKQDNCTNWKHMRTTRSQQRQYEPNETPRLNATHTHQRGNNSAALIAQHLPASLLQAPTTSEHHRPAKTKKIPKGRSQAFSQAFGQGPPSQKKEAFGQAFGQGPPSQKKEAFGQAFGQTLDRPAKKKRTEGLAEGSSFNLPAITHRVPSVPPVTLCPLQAQGEPPARGQPRPKQRQGCPLGAAAAGPRQRGVAPGVGGGRRGAAPQQIAEGRGGFEGSHFSLQIKHPNMLGLYSTCTCVPWLLGWV